jgi:hypothetical protein
MEPYVHLRLAPNPVTRPVTLPWDKVVKQRIPIGPTVRNGKSMTNPESMPNP